MKGWILFFGFLGVLGVVSAASGISSFVANLGGTWITRHPDVPSRCVAGMQGLLLCGIAWAIHRRWRWVWYTVFALFGFLAIETGVDIYLELLRHPHTAITGTVLEGLAVAAVGGYWTYRWYRRRSYFFPENGTG